ncbi:MAG TPA: HAMP domain-containing sensor histidine kinase [Burkholderiales bacterium]|nr:HAMP domain-containing sensor histidine kinase [Burkholderiales bacterium]
MTLYSKLVAVLLGFALIMAVMFLVAIRYSDLARNQEINQKFYGNLASRMLGENVLDPDGTVSAATVQRVADRIQIINPRIDVYLLDAAGGIIAASGTDGVRRHAVKLEPIRRFLADNPQLPIFGDDPSDGSRERVFSVAGVRLKENAQGYLYLVIRSRSGDTLLQRVQNSYVLREMLLLIACGFLLTLLVSTVIIRFMTRRLQRLAQVMDRFRGSGYAEQPARGALRSEAGDEIDQLAGTFNEMADRIHVQMEELRNTDSKRRELVANISHDLRTPLASLQGHLETLQFKGDRLSPEEKRSYLETALRQSERLSHLVAKLFELAKLDSERAAVLPEPFVLADLVQDVVQQFELAASGRSIRIAANLPLKMPLVLADIGLIERALRNLIENSLRHTPPEGEIRVNVIPGAEHAIVQVSDTGCGIDPADLPRIFDRFYRGEKSRSDSSGNAGLGLAIVKRILELHHSAVTVASEPGMTTIGFTLAYADSGHALPQAEAQSDPAAGDSKSTGPSVIPRPLKTRSAAW